MGMEIPPAWLSSFGKDVGLGKGFVRKMEIEDIHLIERIREPERHGGETHINYEIFPSPIKPNTEGKITPLINIHIPLEDG